MTDQRTDRTSGENVRAQMHDLKEHLLTQFEKVAGGPLDGFEMLSRDNFTKAWSAWWMEEFEMPMPTEHAAELKTPGRLVVAMECPECREYAPAAAKLSTVLTDDGSKRTISLKVTPTKVENHVHGQIPLDSSDEAGTEPFDLADIVHEYEPNRANDPEMQRCVFILPSGDRCGKPQDDAVHALPVESDKGEPSST